MTRTYLGEFEHIVLDLWAGSASDADAIRAMEELGSQLARARDSYTTTKAYDEELFGQDFAPEQ